MSAALVFVKAVVVQIIHTVAEYVVIISMIVFSCGAIGLTERLKVRMDHAFDFGSGFL